MITIDLDGDRVPALGFGTWRLDGAACRRAVRHALDLGYRHIDTAQAYENEADVGAALHASGIDRERLWLTTKVWYDNLRADAVRRTTDASLRRLRTDYVDLLLVHWPNDDVPLAETLGAFQEVREAGKARHIGVSNFPAGLLREALEIAPGLVNDQVEYHPYLSQERLLGVVRERGLFLTAYSPIARGEVTDDAILREIAEAHGKSPIQVTIRWHLQQDRVACIPKSGTPEHIAANVDVFDFELSEAEMARIHGLARPDGRMIDPDFAPDWER
ncbi:MAG: aldo/keto reductase [Rhodothermales bacterium]|nr:aldo/keto reductase [Rhodothermales bacterium]